MEQTDTTIHAEDIHALERVIVAPVGGVFRSLPPEGVPTGEVVEAGRAVGAIGRPGDEVIVVSPHTGSFMGLLVFPGERVRERQPLAWVRAVG